MEPEETTRVLPCPNCRLAQKITFVYGSISVDQKCIFCGEYALFHLPSVYDRLVRILKGQQA
jgi:hypothetical protein